jgi:hypothetical protein
MTGPPTRDDLAPRLVRAGELEVCGGKQAETDSYFNTTSYRFHGPDGFEAGYAGLANYFKAIRAVTHSPAGPLPPNGCG